MYRACIFDLDGTLTDSLESLFISVNETMKEMGLPEISLEQCREYVGNGAKVLIEKTLRAVGDKELSRLDEAYELYLKVFDKSCTYHVNPYEGIPEMLAEMKKNNMKLGVLSNKPDRQAVHVVETVFGKETFDLIQGQKEGIPRKPDPAALLTMMEKFGVRPEETLYVGDSEVDAATGKAAHISTVLVRWGFRSYDVLKAAAPDWIVQTTEEILAITENRRKKDE